jgi:hypothetical protein
MGIPFLPDHWYYNTESGELTHGNNLENLGNNVFGGLGWHELNIPGSDSEAQAAAAAVKEFPGGKPPTTSIAKGEANALEQETGVSLPTGINAIGDFFNRLTDKNTWIRFAKIVVGGALLIIGLAHMTGADNAVASAARKVPLPV